MKSEKINVLGIGVDPTNIQEVEISTDRRIAADEKWN